MSSQLLKAGRAGGGRSAGTAESGCSHRTLLCYFCSAPVPTWSGALVQSIRAKIQTTTTLCKVLEQAEQNLLAHTCTQTRGCRVPKQGNKAAVTHTHTHARTPARPHARTPARTGGGGEGGGGGDATNDRCRARTPWGPTDCTSGLINAGVVNLVDLVQASWRCLSPRSPVRLDQALRP